MDSTPASLLQRLRQPEAEEAWTRFVQLYTPLLFGWTRRLGLREEDAGDLVQDVFLTLARKLPEFNYDPGRSFRSWLKTVLLNKWRDRKPRRASLPLKAGEAALADVAGRLDVAADEAEYRHYLVGRALQLIEPEFQATTWNACLEYVVAGKPAADVARDLGVSVNAVYLAKSRLLRRLRQELAGLLD